MYEYNVQLVLISPSSIPVTFQHLTHIWGPHLPISIGLFVNEILPYHKLPSQYVGGHITTPLASFHETLKHLFAVEYS